MMLRDEMVAAVAVGAGLVIYVALGMMLSCGVPPAQHAANVAEGAGQAAELAECRAKGRAAKHDGGAAAYMATYEACADASDKRHGVKP